MIGFVAVLSVVALTFAGCQQEREDSIVIAHRGASGYLPDHTLESKALAFAQGADYLEQDLVMTSDYKLIVLHDLCLDNLTNVADLHPKRSRADGHFYAIDFTLDEIKGLAFGEGWRDVDGEKVQIYPGRFPMGKSRFSIHTFAEEIEFIQGLAFSTGRPIGIYPEIKAPWFHHKEGKDITRAVLRELKRYGYTKPEDRVYLQSFDPNILEWINKELFDEMDMRLNLIQLIAQTDWNEVYEQNEEGDWVPYSFDWMFKPGAMERIASYAQGIGPQVPMLVRSTSSRGDVKLSDMAAEAHKAGLVIHPYTLRRDALPGFVESLDDLHRVMFREAKVEGIFTDFPDLTANYLRGNRFSE